MAAETSGSDSEQGIPAAPAAVPKPESSATDLVLRVLGAIGTGIGVLGFVTFFGAAILWVRTDKAELPATEAVAVIPRNVLISTGAQFLFPALLYAVGVVAVVFLVHFGFQAFQIVKSRQERGKITKRSLEAAELGRKALAKQQEWKAAAAVLESLRENLVKAHEREKPGKEISRLERELAAQRRKAAELQAEAETTISQAAEVRADVDTRTEKTAAKLERGTNQWIAEIAAAVVALAMVVIIDGSVTRVTCSQGLELLALALVSAVLAISVYWATENFVWFGVMAFVVVGVYLGMATYFNTHNSAKMQPVAVLRTGHDPIAGAFIASTSENVYVGTFREKETPPRLLVIPRSQVVELAVGPLLEQRRARRRALTMALNECDQMIKASAPTQLATKVSPTEKSATKTLPKTGEQQGEYAPACTPPQKKKLETALKRGPQTGQLDQPE